MPDPKLRVLLLFPDQLFSCLPPRLAENTAGAQEEAFRRALRRTSIDRTVVTAYQEFHPNQITANDLIVLTSAVATERDPKGIFLASAVAVLRLTWNFIGPIIPVAFSPNSGPATGRQTRVSQLDDPWSWIEHGTGLYGHVNINPTVEDIAEAIRVEASTWRRSS